MTHWHDEVWTERYGSIVCPPKKGKIIRVHGLGNLDAYNPALYEFGSTRILAFRAEERSSSHLKRSTYRPTIHFARQKKDGSWHADDSIHPLDMMEDPFIFYIEEDGMQKVVLGGVRVRNRHGEIIPQTEFYKGETLETLDPVSFAVIHTMKDVRVLQLPDNRFLLCRRPWGDKYKRGRIVLHIIDSLDQLVDADTADLPILAIMDSCQDALDWVGVNQVQILKDSDGRAWIGLLGHVALEDHNTNLHYAACTYKISLQALLDKKLHRVCPQVIATRSCFEAGPVKSERTSDVVFPGHLEHVNDYTYRLWAGLSDARIGVLEIEDPYRLHS